MWRFDITDCCKLKSGPVEGAGILWYKIQVWMIFEVVYFYVAEVACVLADEEKNTSIPVDNQDYDEANGEDAE